MTIASSKTMNKKSVLDIRLSLDTFIHFFLFLSVLLIGADQWGFHFMGVNFRIDQLFLCFFSLLMVLKGEFRFTKNIWIFLFLISTLISTIFAVDIMRGILFYLSILYNVVFLFYAFASYVIYYGLEKFIKIFRITCYFQAALIVTQFVLKVIFHYELPFLPAPGEGFGLPRFQLWFYEPSYLATYISFWFALSLYMLIIKGEKNYLIDSFAALVMFIICTSTSGFIAIALSIAVVYIMWLSHGVTWKKLCFPFAMVLLAILFRFVFKDLYNAFIARLFSGDLNGASGGRIGLWNETFQVFKENLLFGVGPGNYGLYLGKGNEYVPSNVTLDVMATLGIFGLICWVGLNISLIVSAYKCRRANVLNERSLLMACVLGLIIFTVILQINQGYLRLYHWMFFGIIWGGVERIKKSVH